MAAVVLLDSINRRDIRMIQRSQYFGFTLESATRSGVTLELLGQHLNRNITIELQSRARYTSPIPPFPSSPVISYEPSCVPMVKAMISRADYRTTKVSGRITASVHRKSGRAKWKRARPVSEALLNF